MEEEKVYKPRSVHGTKAQKYLNKLTWMVNLSLTAFTLGIIFQKNFLQRMKTDKSNPQSEPADSEKSEGKFPNNSFEESFIEVFKSYKTCTQTKPTLDNQKSTVSIDGTDHVANIQNNSHPFSDSSKNGTENDTFDELFSDEMSAKSSPKVADSLEDERKSPVIPELAHLLENKALTRCPVCLKKNNFETSFTLVAHLKSCAVRNLLTTKQLLRAVEMEVKQQTERLALGLPIKEKAAVKKNYKKKDTIDPNLEMAIALSVSLRESEIETKVRENECLIAAGIEPETLSQVKQLEDYGFVGPNRQGSKSRNNNKNKNHCNAVLFTRTKEDRERIITEKIGILLVDEAESSPIIADLYFDSAPHIRSAYIQMFRDVDSSAWKKSYQLDDFNDDCYYVEKLSNFISPCKDDIAARLKHLSQIPCRLSTPPPSFAPLAETKPEPEAKAKPVRRKLQLHRPSLSDDWKHLLNKSTMSDITIYTKYEKPIYAHKLVFHARCRSILSDTITESNGNKCTEMLMWMDYSYDVVFKFLEYIYADLSDDLDRLNDGQKKEFKVLCKRYDVNCLLEIIDRSEDAVMFEKLVEPEISAVDDGLELFVNDEADVSVGESNLRKLQMELMSPNNGSVSPELFDDREDEQNKMDDEVVVISDSEDDITKSQKRGTSSPLEKLDVKKLKCDDDAESDFDHAFDVRSNDEIDINIPNTIITDKKNELSAGSDISLWNRFDSENNLHFEDCCWDPSKNVTTTSNSLKTPESKTIIYDSGSSGSENTANSLNNVSTPNSKTSFMAERTLSPVTKRWTPISRFRESKSLESSPISSKFNPQTPEFSEFTNNLFDDSFTVDDSFMNKIENGLLGDQKTTCSTPNSVRKLKSRSKSESFVTPTSCNVTPLADYSCMKPEELKVELDRYGIKPNIGRNKAKKLLRHIYNQLHPFEESTPVAKAVNKSPKKLDTDSPKKRLNMDVCDSESDPDSGDSDDMACAEFEESYFEREENEVACSQVYSQNTKIDNLNKGFRKLLDEDNDLNRKVLSYEPLLLEDLHQTLKSNGITCTINELVKYLDEQCIIFQTQQQQGRWKRKKNRKQK